MKYILIVFFIPLYYFSKGFLGKAYKDLQIWYLKRQLNYFAGKYSNGGTVAVGFKFYKFIKKAEKLGYLIDIRFDSYGNCGSLMKINLIQNADS